jgi:hypothetical protein
MNLRDTNPAQIWLAERFAVNLPLVNGNHILVRFDLNSSGANGYRFNEQNVERSFGQLILGDRTDIDIEMYLSTCDSIAWRLNSEIDEVAIDCIGHARQSLYLLDALENGDRLAAKALGIRLGESLLRYGTHADRIWGNWLESIGEHLKSL